MQYANDLILNAAVSNTSPWFNIAQYGDDWSIHATQIESGATLQLYLSNDQASPASSDGALLATLASTGLPLYYQSASSANWLQIVKTPGSGALPTVVRIFSLLG